MVMCVWMQGEQTAAGSSDRTGRGRIFQLQPWTQPRSQRAAGNDHSREQTHGTGVQNSLPCSQLVAPLAEPGGPELSRYPRVCNLEQERSSGGAELCLICEVSTSTWPSAGSGHCSSLQPGHAPPLLPFPFSLSISSSCWHTSLAGPFIARQSWDWFLIRVCVSDECSSLSHTPQVRSTTPTTLYINIFL